jgi:hypothetical protein
LTRARIKINQIGNIILKLANIINVAPMRSKWPMTAQIWCQKITIIHQTGKKGIKLFPVPPPNMQENQ